VFKFLCVVVVANRLAANASQRFLFNNTQTCACTTCSRHWRDVM